MLGPSLEDLFAFCSGKFSLKTSLILGKQIISRLEYLHAKQFLHRDVKPENFCMGMGRKSHVVYIIDYGLSKRYIEPKNGQHIEYRENKKLTGTVRFASLNTHAGCEQSRRDEIEAVAYMMIYFCTGSLPWILSTTMDAVDQSKQQGLDIIHEMKATLPLSEIATADLPIEFEDMLRYTRSL